MSIKSFIEGFSHAIKIGEMHLSNYDNARGASVIAAQKKDLAERLLRHGLNASQPITYRAAKAKWMVAKIIISSIAILLCLFILGSLFIRGIEIEQEWRAERLCRIYGVCEDPIKNNKATGDEYVFTKKT